MDDARTRLAEGYVGEFADRTGLCAGGDPSRRYLWTDAFAVLTMLVLWGRTGDERYRRWAVELVDAVHGVLGVHRPDDPRSGWISGLDRAEGAERPTAGGLRIGKPFAERPPGEPCNEGLEWERDGQYFHYLTKWMLALVGVSGATGDSRYAAWAAELAIVARRAFVYRSAGMSGPRMWWKMSVDLSRPAVEGMGQFDPLDGVVAFGTIQDARGSSDVELAEATVVMREMCDGIGSWATVDALGIGGLLSGAHGLARLIAAGQGGLEGLLARVLSDSERGLGGLVAAGSLCWPCESRLAFRELGLAIGLQSLGPMAETVRRSYGRYSEQEAGEMLERVASLMRFLPLVGQIHRDWLGPRAQRCPSWVAHLDINSIMLAASLVAEEGLLLSGGVGVGTRAGAGGLREATS